jgi:hypothetical protein
MGLRIDPVIGPGWLAGILSVAVLAAACTAAAPTPSPTYNPCNYDPGWYSATPTRSTLLLGGEVVWGPVGDPPWWNPACPANAAFLPGWTAAPFVPVQDAPGPDAPLLVGGGAIVGGCLVALGVLVGRRRRPIVP